MVQRGTREITLLGQNVNSYKAGKVSFVDLLRMLHDVQGLERIRYTSPHPKDFGEPLARAHRDLPKLCEHLHLPFQSGSDRILKAMRRNHKIASYLDKMAMIKRTVPGISVSTDIIVGFPGETEEDFERTLDVMREVKFDHIYAFKYSPRSDTPAAGYGGQVPEPEKVERLAQVLELHEAQQHRANGAMVGSRQEILLEGPHPSDAAAMTGRTRGNKPTMVIHCAQPPGVCVDVEIVATRRFSLVGREVGHGG
jgi:tRNA-2-methylthio-N6-dimethylallyladenosine synthase